MTPKQKDKLKLKIGQNIRDICYEVYGPRNQQKLAKALKLSQGSMSDIMNGKSFPCCETLRALATFLMAQEDINKTLYDVMEVKG